jgi:hypothetical protein
LSFSIFLDQNVKKEFYRVSTCITLRLHICSQNSKSPKSAFSEFAP